jgi:hypothetical protein
MRISPLIVSGLLGCGVVALTAPLAGCTATPSVPAEVLDRDTGATVTSPAKPILFVHSLDSLGSAPFEYVTLVAVDVNRNSRHEHLLLAYGWTSAQAVTTPQDAPALRLVGDDQVVELQPEVRSARDFGIATLPHQPPKGFAGAPFVYRCEVSTWRLLAAARQLTIQVGALDKSPPRYEVWVDGRPALRDMLATLQP